MTSEDSAPNPFGLLTPLFDLGAGLADFGKGLLWMLAAVGVYRAAFLLIGALYLAGQGGDERIQRTREARALAAQVAAQQAAEIAAERERLANLAPYEFVMEGLSPDVRDAIEQGLAAPQPDSAALTAEDIAALRVLSIATWDSLTLPSGRYITRVEADRALAATEGGAR